MRGNLLQRFAQYIKQNKFRRIWQKLVRVLACIVVFCTTYVLILPAITAELATLVANKAVPLAYATLTVNAKNMVQETETPIMVYDDASLAEYKAQFQNSSTTGFLVEVREDEKGNLYVSNISGIETFSTFLKEYDTCQIDHGSDGVCKAFNLIVPYQSFIDSSVAIKVGYSVTALGATSYTNQADGYYEDGLCKLLFNKQTDSESQLTKIDSANTLDLIEVNLYDYNSKVNTFFLQDPQYLGFQQDGGTKSIGSSIGAYSYNFGNNITSDLFPILGVKTDDTINDDSPLGSANYPISGYMWPTMIYVDGQEYPAIKYNQNLAGAVEGIEYIVLSDYFDSNGNVFCDTKNKSNINGLFQYDENTGNYYFNSRDNHAQYDSKNNKFVLYNQVITSNYMMYPFGNFLPFNNIELETQKSTVIDRAYLQEIADNAITKSELETDTDMATAYSNLGSALLKFCQLMDTQKNSITWGGSELLIEYFKKSGLPVTPEMEAAMNSVLSNVYSIDYDEATDFFFGMDMSAYFMQPKNGKIITNRLEPGNMKEEDMIYRFSGDDDVWIYIDDVLFLDLSGIHRHVGGEINFAEGKVYYYSLDPSTGDVADDPAKAYKVQTFKEIITNAYANDPVKKAEALAGLNDKGVFKNYTTHKFNFYYMERGAGSGVYRTNFNLPLLRKNSVSVEKVLKKGEDQVGDPDFFFQILKVDEDGNKTKDLLVDQYDSEGKPMKYYVYDANTNELLREENVGANGVITIKGGERAEVRDVLENAGKYYVRELLDDYYYAQYGGITIEGSAETGGVNGVVIGETSFQGVESAIADASEAVSMFCFTNTIDTDRIGALSISKNVSNVSSKADATKSFDLLVKLDDILIPVGMEYELFENDTWIAIKEVEEEGVISLKAGQTAMIKHLLASTKFEVTEKAASAEGYVPFYEVGNAYKPSANNNSAASGYIWIDPNIDKGITNVKVTVENRENAVEVKIPVTKVIENGDQEPNTSHVYTFMLECLSTIDNNGNDFDLYNGAYQDPEYLSVIGDSVGKFTFDLYYDINDFPKDISFPVELTYKISESGFDKDGIPVTGTIIDKTEYTVVVRIDKMSSGVLETTDFSLKKGNEEVESADFVNILISDLMLEKRLEDIDGHSENAFKFTVSLADVSGNPLANQIFKVDRVCGGETQAIEMQTDADGKLILENVHSTDQIKIKNLLVGTKWTITENDTGIYNVTWEVGSVAKSGTTIDGKIASGPNTVICTNDSSYELPEFGGRGPKSYILTGLALMLLGAVCLLYKNNNQIKKERKNKL